MPSLIDALDDVIFYSAMVAVCGGAGLLVLFILGVVN